MKFRFSKILFNEDKIPWNCKKIRFDSVFQIHFNKLGSIHLLVIIRFKFDSNLF